MNSPAADVPRPIGGLEEISGLYDGFILDLWGVVHDGVRPFPDTIPALLELRKARRKVWLLSNAPRRAHIIAAKLREMGIGEDDIAAELQIIAGRVRAEIWRARLPLAGRCARLDFRLRSPSRRRG